MVGKATIEKLKGKNITINGGEAPKDTLGSSVRGISLQQISDRLKTQTENMKKESAVIASDFEEGKPDAEEDVEVPLKKEEKSVEEYENIPADEFAQLVIEKSVPNLSELDGRSIKRMKRFIQELAEKLNGLDTGNSGEVNKLFEAAIKNEASNTKLGEFLEKNFQGWDGKFEDEPEIPSTSVNGGEGVPRKADTLVGYDKNKASNSDQQRIKEALEKISKVDVSKIKELEEDGPKEKNKNSRGDLTVKENAVIEDKKVGVETENHKVEYPKNPSEFLKKVGSIYFVSKEDISDMKVVSYNPKTQMVKVEFGQRFIEHAPENDEDGKAIPTYSIASRSRMEDIDYEEFMDLIKNDYVTDETQLRERIDEAEKNTRAEAIENISAKYKNDKGDVLLVEEYRPGKKNKPGYTRKKGAFQIQVNDGEIENVPAGKLEQLIKEDGYVKESVTRAGAEKKLKNKKKELKNQEILENAEKEFGRKGTEYVYDGKSIFIDNYQILEDGSVVLVIAPEDGKGGTRVQLDVARELFDKGKLKRAEAQEAEAVTESEQEKQERISEELQEEFGQKGAEYVWMINGKPIKVEIAGFFFDSNSLGKIGFRMKGSDKIHQFHVGDVRDQIKKNFLQKEELVTNKEDIKEENFTKGQVFEKKDGIEEKNDFGEKEEKMLAAYRKYASAYLKEIETYDYEGEGYLKKSIPGEKKRQAERFWEVVLPGKLGKVFEKEELIEKAIEQIKKTEK